MGRRTFGWSLPPGAASDPMAPYNQPDPPECPECEYLIAEADQHADDCPNGDMDGADIAELLHEQHAPNADDYKEDQMER